MENAASKEAASAEKVAESNATFKFPKCPACHIQCNLAKPQCGRGMRLRAAALAGEVIPERKGPMRPPKPGKDAKGGRGPGAQITIDQRLSFLLSVVMPNIIGKPQSDDDKVAILSWLLRQEGAMTAAVMPERAHVDAKTLRENLDQMLELGWVEERASEWGITYYWILEEGKAIAKQEEDSRTAKCEELFSVYSDEEKEQLLDLLEKIIPRPENR